MPVQVDMFYLLMGEIEITSIQNTENALYSDIRGFNMGMLAGKMTVTTGDRTRDQHRRPVAL